MLGKATDFTSIRQKSRTAQALKSRYFGGKTFCCSAAVVGSCRGDLWNITWKTIGINTNIEYC